jgi:hypothetical protein
MKQLILTYHTNPSHGYLQVPLEVLRYVEATTKMSPYSAYNNENAFLEEDCDAGIFIKAVAKAGYNVSFDDKYYPNGFGFLGLRRFEK